MDKYISENKYFIICSVIIVLVILVIHFRLYDFFIKKNTINNKPTQSTNKYVYVPKKPTNNTINKPPLQETKKKVTFADTKKETAIIKNDDINTLIDMYSLDNISKVETFSDNSVLSGIHVDDSNMDKNWEKI